MSRWDDMKWPGGYWLGSQVFAEMGLRDRQARDRRVNQARREMRLDGIDPFEHVRTIRFRGQPGARRRNWVLSAYGCFVVATLLDAVDAELYFGDRTSEFRRTVCRCCFEGCTNAGTRWTWGVTFCTEHMPEFAKAVAA